MIFEMFAQAIRAMGANKLRTFLTALGMVIGVGAVVIMSSVGAGVQESIKKSISSMGSNLFIILSGSTTQGGARSGSGSTPTLTIQDAKAIRELPQVLAVAPVASGNAQVTFGSNNWNTSIIGTNEEYFLVRDWGIEDGYFFDSTHIKSIAKVAVIGKKISTNLFGDENPIGKTIKIKQSPFIVIGILSQKGQSLDGRDQDDTIIIPISTAQKNIFGTQFKDSIRFMMVQGEREDTMDSTQALITDLLRQRHKIKDGEESDFDIRNLTSIANVAQSTSKAMSIMLGAIASISLIVGGIGIMNIMLVSVTERTKEIGIRMAIGANEANILLQFLLEAVIVSIFGCLIGVLLGVGGSLIVDNFLPIKTIITPSSIFWAFFISATIGIFFGFYPAKKASKLEPIEALRY